MSILERHRRDVLSNYINEVNALIPDGAVSTDDLFLLVYGKCKELRPNARSYELLAFSNQTVKSFINIFGQFQTDRYFKSSILPTDEGSSFKISYFTPDAVNLLGNMNNAGDLYKCLQINKDEARQIKMRREGFDIVKGVFKILS